MPAPGDTRTVRLARLRPLAGVLAIIVATLVAASLVLTVVVGPAPLPLRRAEVLDPGEYRRVGEQLATVERERDTIPPDRRSPLAVVIGLSTAREDIDALALGSALCGGMQVLNLGGSGGSFRELAFYLRTLRRSRLRSSLTILAIHPVWLAGRVLGALPPDTGVPIATIAGYSVPQVVTRFVYRWGWLYANRRGMHALLLNSLGDFRDALGERLDLSLGDLFPDVDPAPWAARVSYQGQRGDPRFLRQQLDAWERYGWFDPSVFSSRGEEGDALRMLLREASAIGGKVVVVMLPEHSLARRRIPGIAAYTFREILAGESASQPIDLRDSLSDRLFYDYAHVNAAGRTVVSREIARALGGRMVCPGPDDTGRRVGEPLTFAPSSRGGSDAARVELELTLPRRRATFNEGRRERRRPASISASPPIHRPLDHSNSVVVAVEQGQSRSAARVHRSASRLAAGERPS